MVLQYLLDPSNSMGSRMRLQLDNASVVQASRSVGQKCKYQWSPDSWNLFMPGAGPGPLVNYLNTQSGTTESCDMENNIQTNANGLALGPVSTQPVQGTEKVVTPSWGQVLVNLSPLEWAEKIWDILSGIVGYVVWDFEDLVAQVRLWDGSVMGLLHHTSLIWRGMVTIGIVFGLSQLGPFLEAAVEFMQLAWEVLSTAVRGITGAVETIYNIISSWMEALHNVVQWISSSKE